MFWKEKSYDELNVIIQDALNENKSYRSNSLLGLPATYLDQKIFPFLKSLDSLPYLRALVENPNHIGCHTFGKSEHCFSGTHKIEVDLIQTCAEKIFKAKRGEYNGHVCSGGTDGNIQGLWGIRNYFINEYQCQHNEIAVVCTDDSHYSVYKGANILNLETIQIPVGEFSREINFDTLKEKVIAEQKNGKKYFILFLTMGTTMFGSIDPVDKVVDIFKELDVAFKIHIDAAFGGFVYPFINEENTINFENPYISSIVLDAHKMLQAPFGTGMFLGRNELFENIVASEASYVPGLDSTLCGSRSGANVLAVWMILNIYGSEGGKEYCKGLMTKTSKLCDELDKLSVRYFHQPGINIVTMRSSDISSKVAEKYHLVPESHDGKNLWWKVVIMDHVTNELLDEFINDLKENEIKITD